MRLRNRRSRKGSGGWAGKCFKSGSIDTIDAPRLSQRGLLVPRQHLSKLTPLKGVLGNNILDFKGVRIVSICIQLIKFRVGFPRFFKP